jgi:hypothetical protein
MSNISEPTSSTVELLLESEESQLYEQLGMRSQAINFDVEKAGSFQPVITYDGAKMGAKEDIRELGQKIFYRWNYEIYSLACGKNAEDQADRKKIFEAIGLGEVALASTVTTVLISSFGIAPPIAIVLAAIITKRFFRPAYEEFCGVWSKYVSHSE